MVVCCESKAVREVTYLVRGIACDTTDGRLHCTSSTVDVALEGRTVGVVCHFGWRVWVYIEAGLKQFE